MDDRMPPSPPTAPLGEFRISTLFGCVILRAHLFDGRVFQRSWPISNDDGRGYREAWWQLMGMA